MLRFVAGGVIVSAFAVLGDVLRPKSFASLFGAAPSVALASLSLAFWKHGGGYVSEECRSMILGAIALAIYAEVVCQFLMRSRWSALMSTSVATYVWLLVAVALEKSLIG